MARYQVRFFYSASGMEGQRDEREFSPVEAANETDARTKIVNEIYPDARGHERSFVMSCLSAERI